MPRTPLVVGNWKMHLTLEEATKTALHIRTGLAELRGEVDVAVCPPLPWLVPVEVTLGRSERLGLGAQDAVPGLFGNETGNVSIGMLRDHIQYLIVGHSERRLAGESHQTINTKVRDALRWRITPIVCVGEFTHLYDHRRRRGRPTKLEAESNIFMQLRRALRNVRREQLSRVVIAYEPVWAIDQTDGADPAYVQIMATTLRRAVARQGSKRIAANTRILYGGSVKPANAARYAGLRGIDGVLVGTASRDPEGFLDIVKAFARRDNAETRD